ncbi:unnamed protein product [Durusdinium trenchii]|uniref:Uncharacterized protein n=2 Tax=Durusdinium trenchii TaxID=1381693 RepID=A0ABP0PH54_9DINO
MLPPRWTQFPNEKDACCAWTLWSFLLALYLIYGSLATMNLWKALEEPDYVETSEERMAKPPPSLDVCELVRISASLNYSMLGSVAVACQTGWFSKDGSEDHFDTPLTASQTFDASEGRFRCVRFQSTAAVPKEATVTYYNFYLGLKEPVHPKLYRFGGQYIAGLVFRPSLAENASNQFAFQEDSCLHERLMRMFVPSNVMPGYRNVVATATPSLAKWVDTLGGRMGAASEDTFYFADMTLVPESLQRTSDVNSHTTADSFRYTLKIGLPLSTDLVRVKLHINDVLKCLLNWLGELTSATAVFKLITNLFPAMEKETFRLFLHLPWLHLGLAHPSELDPLAKCRPETAEP